jgi:hypothetical protein
MSKIKIDKVVANLPDPLVADTVYAVRSGTGFDLFISDATGTVAHAINPSGTFVLVGITPPSSPSVNDLWIDTN